LATLERALLKVPFVQLLLMQPTQGLPANVSVPAVHAHLGKSTSSWMMSDKSKTHQSTCVVHINQPNVYVRCIHACSASASGRVQLQLDDVRQINT